MLRALPLKNLQDDVGGCRFGVDIACMICIHHWHEHVGQMYKQGQMT